MNTKTNKILTLYKTEINKTILMAIPLVIGQMGHVMMSVVDSIMIGRLGPAPLAASSVANGLFILIMIIGFGISLAITPLVAMARGAGRFDDCGIILRQGLLVNIGSGVVLFAITLFAAYGIKFLNQPEAIIDQAVIYMQTLGWSILPVMVFQTYRQFSEGVAVMRPAMIIAISANLFNLAANWIFIFGHLGFPALGLTGAGMATFVSRFFMAAAMMTYVMKSLRFKEFDPSLNYRKIDWNMMGKILKIGIPAGIQYFFEVSAFGISAIIIGWLGTKPLAAHQIALNMASISYMFALSISATASVRVATAAGNGDIPAVRRAGFSAIFLGMVLMACFGIFFILFRHMLPSLYVSDTEVCQLTATILVIAAMFQISDGVQTVGLGTLRGIADMKIPTLITFLAYWVVGLPVGYILGFHFNMGISGVWLGLLGALTTSAIMVTTRFYIRSKYHVRV